MHVLTRTRRRTQIWKLSGLEVWRIQVPEKGWCSKFTDGALSNFKGNESRDPSSVPSPKQKPNIVVVVGKQLQFINFMLFFNNPIFLRKFPLIKLQRFWQTGQAKINNSSKYHSMAALFRTFYFKIFFWALPIPAVSQWSTLCARVLVKIPQPISGFWDLSTRPR